MTKRKEAESLEVMVARIDERVEVLHKDWPDLKKIVSRHDREILIAKTTGKIVGTVIILIAIIVLSVKAPLIAEALARVIGA